MDRRLHGPDTNALIGDVVQIARSGRRPLLLCERWALRVMHWVPPRWFFVDGGGSHGLTEARPGRSGRKAIVRSSRASADLETRVRKVLAAPALPIARISPVAVRERCQRRRSFVVAYGRTAACGGGSVGAGFRVGVAASRGGGGAAADILGLRFCSEALAMM